MIRTQWNDDDDDGRIVFKFWYFQWSHMNELGYDQLTARFMKIRDFRRKILPQSTLGKNNDNKQIKNIRAITSARMSHWCVHGMPTKW